MCILPQKLVIFCATRAGANLGVLAFKISVLCQELVDGTTTTMVYRPKYINFTLL